MFREVRCRFRYLVPRLFCQLSEPAFQEPPFRCLLREFQCALIRSARFRGFAQPPAQVGVRCMGEAVIRQFTARQDCFDQRESGCRAVAHGHGHRTIQRNDGRKFQPRQHIIKPDNLRPVGRRGSWRLGMYR